MKVTDSVREFVIECEREIREAEAAEKARIEAVADGIYRDEDGEYFSADRLYSYYFAFNGYISIDCALSGLPNVSGSERGRFSVYLQHPDSQVSEELVDGARDFRRAIEIFRKREEVAREVVEREAEEREKAAKEAPIFAEAKESGERQELRRHTTGCSSRHEECSTDIVTVWALPDGSTETTRIHTW